jgi:hypothetical protein
LGPSPPPEKLYVYHASVDVMSTKVKIVLALLALALVYRVVVRE